MMVKKILLVTLQSDNIGNRLQNYALQEVLKAEGFEVWTPYTNVIEWNTTRKRIKNHIKIILSYLGMNKYVYIKDRRDRIKKFNDFNKKYISHFVKFRYSDAFKKNMDNFDFAIVGSDQVWHKWSEDEFELPYFYLEFLPTEKRISYAPSFGFDVFPENDLNSHKKGICGIKYLSCREEKGAQLIKMLTDREAKVVVDPTLLLEINDWKKIGKKSPLYRGRTYLLIYFLGNKPKEYRKVICNIAEKEKLDIIDIFDRDNRESMLTTPDEFIWLVENASYICTDSYHACIFSIIFSKKFLVFRRNEQGMEKMFDRIEMLF